MTKLSKEESVARQWIKQKFGEVGEEMQIGMYEFHFIYQEQTEESRMVEKADTLLAIRPLGPYKRAEVFISPHAIELAMGKESEDRELLVDAIVHEICHIHTTPLAALTERRYITEQDVREKVEEVTEIMAIYARESLKHRSKIYQGLSTT